MLLKLIVIVLFGTKKLLLDFCTQVIDSSLWTTKTSVAVAVVPINVKKLCFIHELTARDTSKTAKITKSTSPKCQCAVE